MAESTFPGVAGASSNPFRSSSPNVFGSPKGSSAGGMNRVLEEDENDALAGSPTSPGFRPSFGEDGPTSGVAIPAAANPPSSFRSSPPAGSEGFPSNYAMGRRVSVSAESMNPTSASHDSWTAPYHQKTHDQIARLKTAVSGNFLFSHLDDEQTSQVLGALVEKPIPAKDIKVITQGDVGDYFYVVEKGAFDVYVNSTGSLQPGPEGMGSKVATVQPGGSFGELALMYNAPRAATVISTESDSCLWALDRVTFRRILMDSTFQRRRMYEHFLAEVPLLSTLNPYERSKIADALDTQKYPPGTTIIKEGEPGEAFFILESGEANVFKQGVDKPVKEYKKGDYFGELALLNDAPRAASVVSKTEVKVATLGKDGFQRLLGPVEGIMRRNDPSKQST
jgi:cAMP-dependent protein kinase regulator